MLVGCDSGETSTLSGKTRREASTGNLSEHTAQISKKMPAVAAISIEPHELVLAPGAFHKLSADGHTESKRTIPLTAADGLSLSINRPELARIETDGTLRVSEQAKTGDILELTYRFQQWEHKQTVKIKQPLQESLAVNSRGLSIVTNPSDTVVVVNKKRNLPNQYIPPDLVEPNVPFAFKEQGEKRLLRKEAAKALEQLFAKAAEEHIKLYGVSAYRSYITQQTLFNYYVKVQGQQQARQYSAQPGQSEHQTGLAIDVSSASAKFALEESFAQTAEGKWLAQNAAAFGFILRYPKGKEAITGYAFEPWHIRYVGRSIAEDIAQKQITLEEYFDDAVPVQKNKGS